MFDHQSHFAPNAACPLRMSFEGKPTTLKDAVGLVIQFIKQHCLPGGPDVRPNGADIGNGQQIEHLEVFAGLHLVGKIDNHRFIGEVASLGDMCKDQMLAY